CRTLLRGAATGRSPGDVLSTVNDLLRPDIPESMFVTCLYGILDPTDGRFVFANAGHNLPFLRRRQSALELRATGMPLGLLSDMTYEEVEVTMEPGDLLVLSSDGLVEAHSPSREMFGFPRVEELIRTLPPDAGLIDWLLDAQREFVGPRWEQEDDITLLTIGRMS
ncbi:MAG TPA: PP2C family protein-serine/threonine phosphatase, partial [Acidimicrobiia bacterium]